MAGINVSKDSSRIEEKSYDELLQEFEKLKKETKAYVEASKNDKNIPEETKKSTLRAKYSKLAILAKKLMELATKDEDAKILANQYEHFSNRAASYGSLVSRKKALTSLDDIKGLDNVKELIKSFFFILQNQELMKYYKLDGGLGMMMYGAPGTGKTMFAEAIANYMNLPLFVVTPADIFKSYVGASEAAVKDLFLEIDACEEGAVLFIDECESIFSKRTGETKDYKSSVTTELLQRMNGFGVDGGKRIMIAATNRPDQIDSAYLRYKRFSYLVHVTPPDDVALKAIIESKLKHKDGSRIELASDISIDGIMAMAENYIYEIKDEGLGPVRVRTAYYSAADISGIVEEACRLAIEHLQINKLSTPIPLNKSMFEKAFDKIRPSISAKLLEKLERFKEDKEMKWDD